MNKKIAVTVILIFASLVLFVWSGIYNIGANDKHWAVTSSIINTLRERSIEVRAADIAIPNDFNEKSRLITGAANYDKMCAQCHLFPGGEKTEIHVGLYPLPPVFYQDTDTHEEHSLQNNFWVIKNGIKLTGMPAWGASHSDDDIWSLVAFLDVLDKLTANQYKELISTDPSKSLSASHE